MINKKTTNEVVCGGRDYDHFCGICGYPIEDTWEIQKGQCSYCLNGEERR